MNVPEEEKYLNTEAEIRAMLVQFLGGRAAEEIVFETVTTGAANDIERATKLARAMVTQYGMSKEFGLMALESIENQYLTGRTVLNCADQTASGVDAVVMQTLKDSYEKAKELLMGHRRSLDEIAAFLIEKESITGAEFMEIFHRIEREEHPELYPVEETENVDEAGAIDETAIADEAVVVEENGTVEEAGTVEGSDSFTENLDALKQEAESIMKDAIFQVEQSSAGDAAEDLNEDSEA